MGLLAGGMALAGGAMGASKARGYASNMRHAQERAIANMKRLQAAGMFQSEEFFNLALEELNAVGPQMRQDLLAYGEEGLANAEASAIGTGLHGTTAMAGAQRGMRRDVGRNLGMLEERLAGARSGLYQQRGLDLYNQFLDRVNISQRTKWDTTSSNFLSSMSSGYGEMGAAAGGFLEDAYDWYQNKDGGGGGLDLGEDDR